jgi:hypothetical protein
VCACEQVPFIGWSSALPLLGQPLYRLLADISGSTARLLFQRTGQQFFLLDGAAPDNAATAGAGGLGGGSTAAAAAGAASPCDQQQLGGADAASSTAQLPLLLQMTQDCPDRGLYFYSALAAFRSRTAYANMGAWLVLGAGRGAGQCRANSALLLTHC